jgi:hypothetical protein
MPKRRFDNSQHEKAKAKQLVRQWYQAQGETVEKVRTHEAAWLRRQNRYLYETERETTWGVGKLAVRMVTIIKGGEKYLVAFDSILGTSTDKIVELIEWKKPSGLTPSQGRVRVTKFWRDKDFNARPALRA